jgi:hypothetical protein
MKRLNLFKKMVVVFLIVLMTNEVKSQTLNYVGTHYSSIEKKWRYLDRMA